MEHINRKILTEQLRLGLKQLPMELSQQQQKALLDYLLELNKWNKAYNLTAIRQLEQMVIFHLLDSLVIMPFIQGERVVDVGTGAGLPGVPLAIAFPNKRFVLVDSNGKKTRFLVHIKHMLHLNNIEVIQSRVEQLPSHERFHHVLSRAFSSLSDFANKTAHLCAKNGSLLAMKGKDPEEEIAGLEQNWLIKVNKLAVPGLSAERHLVCLEAKIKDKE